MRAALRSCLGIAICFGTAAFLSILLSDGGEIRLAAPVLCLIVVVSTSLYWGRHAGFIGSVAATLTLAVLLFPPLGSLYVQETGARTVLVLFQLSAIGAVLITPRNSVLQLALKSQTLPAVSSAPSRQFRKQRDSR